MRITQQARTGSTRALLICAALACLCASDGVGPRLLPYPALTHSRADAFAPAQQSPHREGQTEADQRDPAAETVKAGDSSSKLPVFSTQGVSFIRPAARGLKVGAAGSVPRPTAPATLRAGRAPPSRA